MIILGDYLQVEELQKDIQINGIIQKYDDSSPYMFGKIINGKEDVINNLSKYGDIESIVVIFRRPAKIPFIGSYLVDAKDIIGIMTMNEYEAL